MSETALTENAMSENAQQQSASGQLQQTLVQHFAEAATTVLSQVAGTPLEAQPSLLDAPSEAATVLRLEISGSLDGLCEITLTASMSTHFASLLTGEAPEPSNEISNDTREAAAELIQQICGNAADRLRRAFGPLELKTHLAERDPASNSCQLFRIARENDSLEFELHILRLALPPESVASAEQPPRCTTPESPQPSAAPAVASSATPSTDPSANRNLDLLLDIELGVTMRFGSRQMLLKEIIELSSGSVVELDRRVEEPVELLIDGRLIAHGEVVVVDGNYGIRVTQVANQRDKIACLP